MIAQRAIIQELKTEYLYHLAVLRLDLLDPEISGNKWFKLKRNLDEARRLGHTKILTFGGAYSNHIAAFAAACKRFGFSSVGVIRGEKQVETNETLARALHDGMHLHYVSREDYKLKEEKKFLNDLHRKFGQYYLIPEGGNNLQGILGCAEILSGQKNYDYVICACGTGATFAGLCISSGEAQKIIGISVLKGENKMVDEVRQTLHAFDKAKHKKILGNEILQEDVLNENCIINSYAFKGYASFDPDWYHFKTRFEHTHNIPLDYVYTSKMMYAVFALLENKKFRPDARILIVHSGGLQGNKGFETRYHLTPSL
ncbi:MAG: pyridoxal-phosphate dependent enzyme [Bacteroidia bacterium]|nr:pyridoxal-phosphate dependent enzyme [Bacteroidia bacterium]